MSLPKKVKIVEVGPRDGLQNEIATIATAVKVEFINCLAKTGLKWIETTSFVSPQWLPQMADHAEIMQKIARVAGVHYSALVPNLQGMEAALKNPINEVAIFTAASETFSKKNTNCTIAESFVRFKPVIELAKQYKIPVRGYISCALGCPYEGEIKAAQVLPVAAQLFELGCYEISLGDTIGVGTVSTVKKLIETVSKKIPLKKLAVHFHDTYGQALVNIYAALEEGISIIDSSVAGLGGCPYAPGAAGNVATEDVVYMLNGLGIETGINLSALIKIGNFISDYLGHPTRSRVGLAMSNV